MVKQTQKYGSMASWGGHCSKVIDLAVVLLAGWVSYCYYFSALEVNAEKYSWAILVGTVLAASLFPLFNFYASWRGKGLGRIAYDLLKGYIAWGMSIVLMLFLFKLSEKFSRGWLIYWGVGAFAMTLFIRTFAYVIYRKVLLKHKYDVVLIGDYDYCRQVNSALRQDRFSEFRVSRIFIDDTSRAAEQGWLSYDAHLSLDIDEDEVWICLPISRGDEVTSIVDALDKMSLNIRFMPGMQELRLINHKVSSFSGVRLLDISCSPMTTGKRIVKRAEDIVLSSLILLLISPIMLVVALGVKLASPGPVFYRQARVSWNNQTFGMLKFRSMPVDSEKGKVEWGNARNKQVTPFGRFIRKTSLDELPQFLNVLKGDMSIVGPRPERDIFVEKFGEEIPGYMQKHMVKAGITGWAQIHGLRGDTSLERRVEYDLWYIENWSLRLDIKIIALTLFRVLSDKTAI